MDTMILLLIPLLVSLVANLVQFLTTRKMVDLDKFKETVKELQPRVEQTPNKVDDVLIDILNALTELLQRTAQTDEKVIE